MKILILQESDWLKRNNHQQHHLAEKMSLRGHEIKVIDYGMVSQDKWYSDRVIHTDVTKIYLGARVTVIQPAAIRVPGLSYLSLLWTHKMEIRRQLREFQPDVIVGFGILNSYLAASATEHVPFVYYWLDVLHDLIPYRALRPIGKVLEKKVLRKADRVITINKALSEYVCSLGASQQKLSTLGAGITFSMFDRDISGKEVRDRYGIKETDTVLMFMGWLYRFLGLGDVIKGLAALNDDRVKLIVVGDGDDYNHLLTIRSQLHLNGQVFLVGKRSYAQIPQFIAAADVCILPAYTSEPTMQHNVPIKLYEYMAMGKPVVATKLLGVILEFGMSSGIEYVDEPYDVAESAVRIARSPKARQQQQERALRTMANRTWDSITDQFEEILQDVIDEKRKGVQM